MTSRRLLSPVAAALLRAADYIAKYGHHKRGFYGRPGCHGSKPPACAHAALLASNQDWNVSAAACRLLAKKVRSITKWNDAPERTADEVVSTLRSVALSLAPPEG